MSRWLVTPREGTGLHIDPFIVSAVTLLNAMELVRWKCPGVPTNDLEMVLVEEEMDEHTSG